jgi:6-phospho-3-hexuloisomerase
VIFYGDIIYLGNGGYRMEISKRIHSLAVQAEKNLESIDPTHVTQLLESISKAKQIFTAGLGRSKLIAQLFAIRLHRLGMRVNVVSEGGLDVSPPIKGEGALVVAISGSGETQFIIDYAEYAKELGAEVFAVTSNPDSRLAKMATHCIFVKGRTKKWEYRNFLEREFSGEHEPMTLEGSMFEISSLIFLEGICTELAQMRK